METKANYVAVGIFTILVFLAAFAFVYWMSRDSSGVRLMPLNVVINGSVTGLGAGSPVKFNGIDVGKVNSIDFVPDNPNEVIARTQVRSDLPVTGTTTAVLAYTGLTGIAHIELKGGDITNPSVFQIANETGEMAQIRGEPAAVEDLLATAQDIFKRADNVLGDLEKLATDVRGPITNTLKNAERITQAVADNSGDIEQFMSSLGSVGDTLDSFATSLDATLEGANKLIAAISPEEIERIIGDVGGFTQNLAQTSDRFDALAESAQTTLAGLENTGTRVTATFDRVDTLLEAVDPESVGTAIDRISTASDSVAKAAEDVAELTGTISNRTDDIDTIFDNVTELSERLNASSARVDGVLAKLDSFLGDSEGGNDLIAEASATLRSFRDVADTLNSRLDGITAGLERFSGRGLQEVEALVSETRRSITRIERAVSAIESNPQRLLFGGEGDVKRFSGGSSDRNRR